MPNWADENGRYWWAPPGEGWQHEREIPHAPVASPPGCRCRKCEYDRTKVEPVTVERRGCFCGWVGDDERCPSCGSNTLPVDVKV